MYFNVFKITAHPLCPNKTYFCVFYPFPSVINWKMKISKFQPTHNYKCGNISANLTTRTYYFWGWITIKIKDQIQGHGLILDRPLPIWSNPHGAIFQLPFLLIPVHLLGQLIIILGGIWWCLAWHLISRQIWTLSIIFMIYFCIASWYTHPLDYI